jgi:hypothetical protein
MVSLLKTAWAWILTGIEDEIKIMPVIRMYFAFISGYYKSCNIRFVL